MKNVGVVLFLGALAGLIAGCWFWFSASDATLKQGIAAYRRGDWEASRIAARERLKTAPDDFEAWQLLARSASRLGNDDSAQALYDQRIKSERMEGEDYYLLGTGLVRQGQAAASIAVFEEGLKIDPRNPEMLQDLGRLYAQQDDLVRATRLAERLSEVPAWEARGDVLVGVLEAEQSNFQAAAERLERALKRDPTLKGAMASPSKVRKVLARALLRTGKPGEARATLQPVFAEGSDPEASWLLGRALLQEGDVADATATLDPSREYSEDAAASTQEPASYVGAKKCAECHKSIHKSQQSSLHARTFFPTSSLGTIALPQGPVKDKYAPSVVHTLKREDGKILAETRVDDETFKAIVDYGIGSGDRGLTLVGHDGNNRFRELRLSKYGDGSGWDVTIGQRPQPRNHEEYLGLSLRDDEVHGCVHCHTTDGRAARELTGPTVADHGIGCERCHGPGENHVKAVETKFADLAIARPQLMSAERQVKLCAQCHSPKGNPVLHPDDKTTIRFQAVHFVKSRCYTESNGGLSCLTCHNPHRDAESSPAFYEAKCLSCHSPSTAGTGKQKKNTSCPVNSKNDCLKCHMPVEKDAIPQAPFSDHHIRVHR